MELLVLRKELGRQGVLSVDRALQMMPGKSIGWRAEKCSRTCRKYGHKHFWAPGGLRPRFRRWH